MNKSNMEVQAERLGLKYFRCWCRNYYNFLVENHLKHNEDLMIAYYNRVVLLK